MTVNQNNCSFKFLQLNLQKSPIALSLTQSYATRLNIDCLILQEIPFSRGKVKGWNQTDRAQWFYLAPAEGFLYTAVVIRDPDLAAHLVARASDNYSTTIELSTGREKICQLDILARRDQHRSFHLQLS